jgi:hypothetical protein
MMYSYSQDDSMWIRKLTLAINIFGAQEEAMFECDA